MLRRASRTDDTCTPACRSEHPPRFLDFFLLSVLALKQHNPAGHPARTHLLDRPLQHLKVMCGLNMLLPDGGEVRRGLKQQM
jgi:hypothetical protein